jgi:hypothetical protein
MCIGVSVYSRYEPFAAILWYTGYQCTLGANSESYFIPQEVRLRQQKLRKETAIDEQ